MTHYIRALLVVGMLSLGFGVAIAGPLENGIAANQKGDYAKALAIFRPLAERGDAKAQFALGAMYWNGHGVAKNSRQASRWFQLSAGQGEAEAQHAMGLMYSSGDGVTKDEKKAAKLFQLAAEHGFSPAQYVLGVIYDGGMGVAQDSSEAVKWFRLGAKQGHAQAQFSLAAMYAMGKGVPKDAIRAQMWFVLSLAHRADDPGHWIDRWAKTMSKDQITQAQAMASRCQATKYKDCD